MIIAGSCIRSVPQILRILRSKRCAQRSARLCRQSISKHEARWIVGYPYSIACACSVQGISATAVVVETLCYTVIVGYNVNNSYVFSSYGDIFACWLQNALVCALLLWYRRPPAAVCVAGSAAFLAFNYWVVSGACGMQVLLALQVRSRRAGSSAAPVACTSCWPVRCCPLVLGACIARV